MKQKIEQPNPFKNMRRMVDGRSYAELMHSIKEKNEKGEKLDEVETEFLPELREDDRKDDNLHYEH